MPFTDEEDALMKINCTTYGLATGFWTKDVTRVFRMNRKIESGTVWVNTFGPFDIAAPWTGYKNSGLGTEWGKEMLNFVTRPKNLWINTA
jgi:acyl-CoA reductase-like NAD-dependent aldehyde dehydrogenase